MEQQLIEMFDQYANTFADWKTEEISKHWCIPATISLGDQVTTFATREDFHSNTDVLCEFYRAQGVEHAEAHLLCSTMLLPSAAQASVRYIVTGPEKVAICEWTHYYVVRRIGNDWRIAFAIADDEVSAWAARGTPLG